MVPRVDGEYIPAHPARLLREGQYNKVELMSGICANEGASMVLGKEGCSHYKHYEYYNLHSFREKHTTNVFLYLRCFVYCRNCTPSYVTVKKLEQDQNIVQNLV